MIEALACGTPVIGLDSGAIPEVIINGENGLLVKKVQKIGADQLDEEATAQAIALALGKLNTIQRTACREDFENRFSLERMCQEHKTAYLDLIQSQDQS
jgi:glycosyltransferase involved in cell wall biosynthesis